MTIKKKIKDFTNEYNEIIDREEFKKYILELQKEVKKLWKIYYNQKK